MLNVETLSFRLIYEISFPFISNSFFNPLEYISYEQGMNVYNHPNPVRGETRFVFYLIKAINTTAVIKIYDTQGRLIDVLEQAVDKAGKYEVLWNSESLPLGTYFYTIEVDGEILKGKLTKV